MRKQKSNIGIESQIKICHFSSVHQILDPRIFYRECTALAKIGYKIILICPCGKNQSINGIKIINYFRINNRFIRILFSPLILRYALKQRADIYHFHSVELIPSGLILKVIFGKKVIYDVHEDFPSMMLNKKYIPNYLKNYFRQFIRFIEKISARIFDGIVTADPFLQRNFNHITSPKKIVFLNLPSLDMYKNLQIYKKFKDFDIVYVGGMSERAGTYILIDAVRELVRKGIKARVLLRGYFDNEKVRKEIDRKIVSSGLKNYFDINGYVPYKDVPRLLSKAKIGVVPLQPIPKFLKNIPSKMFDYWACGLPVVASDLPPARLFFKENKYGYLVEPSDPKEYADAFQYLLENPKKAKKMGKMAQKAVFERLNLVSEGQKLDNFYKSVLKIQ